MTLADVRGAGEQKTILWLVVAGLALIAANALVLYLFGNPAICPCGVVRLWQGSPVAGEDSQHLTDWYTASHVIHGIAFYWLAKLALPRQSVGVRALVAIAVEAGWEIVENTPLLIERYRNVTMAADYHGDSIVNSTVDLLAMVVGFFLAARLPVWASVLVIVVLELAALLAIRDNLTLNVLMLVFPVDAVLEWQSAS